MKKILPLITIVLIGSLLAFVLMPDKKSAPEFSLADLNGKTVSNADLQGKVTFINFWFPSCPGCVSEMPKVIKMAKDYRGKNFQVLGIAEPFDPPESVREYVQQYGLPFTVMYDSDKAAAKSFGTQVYPTSFLIGKNGEILKTFVGEPDFGKLYREIDAELEK
ncbi:peroxiredoxin family protein [Neisseria chenwenguii]|uniref:Thioredoxin n=1 Tax=Neisseria chenwenguii TaxID=1853278 RepID=A0A220S264_9NEIS|nr:TlpA disulfide reductase family protein [Neisseria chenwenguii]ASK27574.1 thioredoxin [Neisseria chenwenguii]ROV55539.1 TlpA family protein disulfide reductase [Neisseria chenwenguii]